MTGANLGGAQRLVRLLQVLLVAFTLVALALVFWSVWRASDILARADNPRTVEAELRIQRGSILDRRGTLLAETIATPDGLVRRYPIRDIGPAVGYYSFRHGTSGVEQGADDVLRGVTGSGWGDVWRAQLHLPQNGRDVRITLDAALQQLAETLLGERSGAALLLEISHDCAPAACPAAVRAMVSHPTYDPNLLNDQFEALVADEAAPLLNRAAQGQYQPGLLLQPFILATALQQGLVSLDEPVVATAAPVAVGGRMLACATPPPANPIWADVLRHRCPAPMQALGARLGAEGLDAAFAAFGLTRDPVLSMETETRPDAHTVDPLLAGVGQENLSVTPLQVGLAFAALGLEGRVPAPQILAALQAENGQWQMAKPQGDAWETAVTTGDSVLAALPDHSGIHEHQVVVLSGPAGSTNAWYVSLLPGAEANFVAVVVVERSADESIAAEIGRSLLLSAARVVP